MEKSELGRSEDKSMVIASVRGRVVKLSMQQFTSNVVQACVIHATPAERFFLINEVCQCSNK